MQTVALLHDSLRLLLARKLFWVTLLISSLLVVAYGSIGFDEKGISILFGAFHFEDSRFSAGSPVARALILGILTTFIVPVWLAWGATILGLVSTANTFPDLMSDGAIDLVLSKPLTRIQLFLVKYAGALLFMALQTLVFCLGVFLVIGLRLGEWNWRIFAGAGVVVLFFSYLYAFLTLVAIMTRSTIAALLFTMLFWFGLFVLQATEKNLSQYAKTQMSELQEQDRHIERQRVRLERARSPGSVRDALGSALTNPEALERQIEALEEEREATAQSARSFGLWHRRSAALMAVLPKNQETIGLLDRWLIEDQNLTMAEIMFGAMSPELETGATGAEDAKAGEPAPRRRTDHSGLTEAQKKGARLDQEERREKPALFVIGTSLAFEALILGVACWIFVRRDF